jgi:hypothetical protein
MPDTSGGSAFNGLITRSVADTAYNPTLTQLSYAVRIDQTWKPLTAASAVVPAQTINYTIDTSIASTINPSHAIGCLSLLYGQGGGTVDLAFHQEMRTGLRNSTHANILIGTKYVFEPDVSNSGTCDTFVLEQFDTMPSVTWIGKLQRNFLEPRMTTYHYGGMQFLPVLVGGNYTFLDSDSGKVFVLNSASNATWTIPSTLGDGFRVCMMQGTLGGQITLVSGGRTVINSATRTTTGFSFDTVDVTAAGGAYLLYNWWNPLPSSLISNSSPITTATTTMASVLSLPVEANSTYEVSIDGAYTTTSTVQALKLGISTTATSSTFILNGRIQISNVGGTSNSFEGPINSLGVALTAPSSVNIVDQNFSIKGKIITSSTAGTFSLQIGAGSTLSTLTIAANRCSMGLRKLA